MQPPSPDHYHHLHTQMATIASHLRTIDQEIYSCETRYLERTKTKVDLVACRAISSLDSPTILLITPTDTTIPDSHAS